MILEAILKFIFVSSEVIKLNILANIFRKWVVLIENREWVTGMNQQMENLMALWHLLWIRSADLQIENNKTHQSLDVVIVNLENWPFVIYQDNNEGIHILMILCTAEHKENKNGFATILFNLTLQVREARKEADLTIVEMEVCEGMCTSSMYIFVFFQIMHWIVQFISPNCSLPFNNKDIAA